METKTKDGKYFSQIGTWQGLIKIIILVLILKIFGILIAILASAIIIFVLPKVFKKRKRTL